jgi:dsRNA-specific ribonuclease
MWPTPQASDYKNMDTAKQKMLSSEVKMWPTPRVSDTEGGVVKNVEYQNESFSRKNKKGQRWGVKLKDAVNHVATVQLDQKKTIGALNPMWVAWLMGYPTEYLNSVHWETRSSRKS